MNRDTKEFTTSSGENKIVYKSYITGGETEALKEVLLEGAKVNMIGPNVTVDGINPTAEIKQNKKKIELLIVSLNDSPDNILERVLDLPSNEYEEIVGVVSSISGKKKE